MLLHRSEALQGANALFLVANRKDVVDSITESQVWSGGHHDHLLFGGRCLVGFLLNSARGRLNSDRIAARRRPVNQHHGDE